MLVKSIFFHLRNTVNYLLILHILISIIAYSCGKPDDKNTSIQVKCSELKIDSLIQQIVFVPEIYTPREGVDSRSRFLVLNMLKSKRDTLHGFSNVLFLVTKDTLKYNAGTVTLDSVLFNHDTTKAYIEVGYYILNGFRSSTTYVNYEWNDMVCNWSLIKKTEGIH